MAIMHPNTDSSPHKEAFFFIKKKVLAVCSVQINVNMHDKVNSFDEQKGSATCLISTNNRSWGFCGKKEKKRRE